MALIYLNRNLKETFMVIAIGLIVLVVSVIIYIALMTMVLPKGILKVVYKVNEPTDRGSKKCLFEGKNCIVYNSSKENRQYIKQYILLQEEGYKSLKCKLAPLVDYLDYDVVLFDRYNKVFGVINVKEDILGFELTRSTRLPDETAYVRIVIRKVNKLTLTKKPLVKIKGGSIFGFGLVATLMTAIEAFIVRACCSYSFGGLFRESFISSTQGILFIGILAVVTGIIGAVAVALGASKRAKR